MEGIPYFYGVLTWSTFGTFSASRRSVLTHFSEVRGKIGNRIPQPVFLQQNRRSRKLKIGVWSADLGFSPHFWKRSTEVCGKFRKP